MEVLINPPATSDLTPKDLLPLVGAALAFAGVLLTIIASSIIQGRTLRGNSEQQLADDARKFEDALRLQKIKLEEEVDTARGLIFAQISRVYRSIQGEYQYLEESPLRYIWIPLYPTLLPSVESLTRVERLTAQEVIDITAFYYSYHEQMGYVTSASGGVGTHRLKLDADLVGVDVSADHLQLKWVMDALAIIERKALKALESIAEAASLATRNPEFNTRLGSENAYSAEKAAVGRRAASAVWARVKKANQAADEGEARA